MLCPCHARLNPGVAFVSSSSPQSPRHSRAAGSSNHHFRPLHPTRGAQKRSVRPRRFFRHSVLNLWPPVADMDARARFRRLALSTPVKPISRCAGTPIIPKCVLRAGNGCLGGSANRQSKSAQANSQGTVTSTKTRRQGLAVAVRIPELAQIRSLWLMPYQ